MSLLTLLLLMVKQEHGRMRGDPRLNGNVRAMFFLLLCPHSRTLVQLTVVSSSILEAELSLSKVNVTKASKKLDT